MQKGDTFKREFLVTPKIYNGFIDLFEDKNPMHTQEAYAVAHGFEGVIMHGNILCGFLSYFVGECLPSKNVIIMAQTINFHKPFFQNEVLVFESTIKGVFANDSVYEFKFKFKKKETQSLVSKGSIQVNLLK